ncbi:unnamed protein product [Psylliodes chrysocephalus]|uniref:SANT domain-containing protein n=1 Tax=Psylliodes chrysocephalus TaxID=3402493 RepID=A0A9P0D4F1_9CUCU|nr:unnamed protein product [Psylliodes chrysocephala]
MESKTDNNSEEKSSEITMVAVAEEEPLGSLTLPDVPELKGQQLRSSARVFKKMKLDTAPLVVPEKCEEKKEIVKESKKKCFKPLWSSDDKTLFFEALNEYGKDFESIQLYISNKFRKKGLPDQFIKTKEQIRHLYYRTWAKISKYLKFADGIKKPTQELYALINYGELRKKIGSVNEKYLVKLNKLIYKGSIVLSIKGKKIRIKTPFCRALRKLNQLDDNYEEIKLPNRLAVELRPKDMASFLRVQSTAQNPRLKTYMPLQKRLSGLIDCLSKKWQNFDAGMYDKALVTNNPVTATCIPSEKEIEMNRERLNPLLRLTPPPGSKIELPSISLGEYFTRQSICFNSHETRLGLSGYNSYCNYSIYKMLSNRSKKGARPRADSVSDKSEKSPQKTVEENCDTTETEPAGEASNKDNAGVSKESGSNVKEVVANGKGTAAKHGGENSGAAAAKKQEDVKVNGAAQNVILEAEKQERINAIRRGWTAKESECITLGEAYLMFGHNSTLVLEYSWDPQNIPPPKSEITDIIKTEPESEPVIPPPALDLSEPLSKLLSVAKLHYRKNIIKCPCGHVCGNKTNAQLKKDVETKIRKILTDIDKCTDENEEKVTTVFHNGDNGGTFITPPVYLPPKIPINPYFQANTMQLASQIASIQRLTPRYCNRKGRRPRSKQVVVERQLPLLPNNIESGHQIVRMNIISKEDSNPPHTVSETPPYSKPITINTNIFIPSTSSDSIIKPFEVLDETLKGTIDFEPSSPSRILKEGEQWINSEVGDYSLSSLLGHLESPVKSETNILNDDSRMSQDVDAQLRSMLTQNSVDFSSNFAELAAQVARDKRNDIG